MEFILFESIIYFICFIALGIASLTDLKKREVPDWINFGLIATGLGLRLIFSFYYKDYNYILFGVIGLVLMYILALFLFYTGQWGGGDSKMLMGLGAMIGFPIVFPLFDLNVLAGLLLFESIIMLFLFNLLIVGGIYGLLWAFGLIIYYNKTFFKNLKITLSKKLMKRIQLILALLSIFGIIFSFFMDSSIRFIIILLSIMPLLIFYMWNIVKEVELTCMVADRNVEELTEGDWIVDDIIVNKIIIAKKGDIITKKIINEIYKIKQLKKILIERKLLFFSFKKRISSDEIRINDKIEENFKINKLSFNKGYIINKNDFIKINALYGYYQIKRKRKIFNLFKKNKIFKKLLFFISEFKIKYIYYTDLKDNDIILHDINLNNFFISKKTILNKKILNQIEDYFKFSFNSINIKRNFVNIPFIYKFNEKKIKENDVLFDDLFFGEYITGPKDLGISKEQIRKLIKLKKLGKIDKVKVKEGIPFIPSFFIAFLITIIFKANIFLEIFLLFS
jgi:Flp pilus assembly protein protease CpaA